MLSTLRVFAIVTAAAMVLALPTTSRAGASRAPSEPLSSKVGSDLSVSGAEPAVVRTVSVPGGMSSEMRAALQNIEGVSVQMGAAVQSVEDPLSPSPRRLRTYRRADGTGVLSSTSPFLHVYIGAIDGDGALKARCVSSLDEALRETASDHVPAVAAEEERE